MTLRAWGAFVWLFAALLPGAAAQERSEFERSFIGREWTLQSSDLDSYPLSEQCRYIGGYMLQMPEGPEELGIDSFLCDGQALELLSVFIAEGRVRILDALLMPRLMPGERYMMTGDCALTGRTDTDFHVIVNLGKREKVNWKTGVRAAWLPNVKTRKFEPLSTRHIVCWRPTPP